MKKYYYVLFGVCSWACLCILCWSLMYCLELVCCLDKKMSKMYFRSFCVVFKKCQTTTTTTKPFKNVKDANKKTASCVVYVSNQFVCSLLMAKVVANSHNRRQGHISHYILRTDNLNQNNQGCQTLSLFWQQILFTPVFQRIWIPTEAPLK
jgi:hypothetical protein